MKKLNVALVGLKFGGHFVEIYENHPLVNKVFVYDIDSSVLSACTDRLKVIPCNSFEQILENDQIDAVHLITPIPLHEEQTVRVLDSGKHCACTVPMASTLDGIQRILDAVKRSGKKYMMMETSLYTYQYLYAKNLLASGSLGKVQFLRGCHYQDMTFWPEYWEGLPPMHYGTHAIAPLVGLAGSRIQKVSCIGSGSMSESLVKKYGNPYPVESAHLSFENGLKGETTRSLFETAKEYVEGFCVYGSDMSFEWGFKDDSLPYLTRFTGGPRNPERRGKPVESKTIEMPNYYDRLPESIQKYTVGKGFDPTNPQDSLRKGSSSVGAHHGSHPHLVHEFIMSILEDRKPAIDEELGANITGAGICAHISAMQDGEWIDVPAFK